MKKCVMGNGQTYLRNMEFLSVLWRPSPWERILILIGSNLLVTTNMTDPFGTHVDLAIAAHGPEVDKQTEDMQVAYRSGLKCRRKRMTNWTDMGPDPKWIYADEHCNPITYPKPGWELVPSGEKFRCPFCGKQFAEDPVTVNGGFLGFVALEGEWPLCIECHDRWRKEKPYGDKI